MTKEVYIVKKVPPKISLEEWLTYISSSSILQPVKARQGINPFTKKPTEFHPGPGSVFFTTASGKCSIGFHYGVLSANVPNSEAMAVIEQIAAALDAKVTESPD